MPDDVPYRPPFWYRGRHLQTLWGPLLRHWRRPSLRRERLETPDGDFVDLDWLDGAPESGPLIIILHGLEGSSRSEEHTSELQSQSNSVCRLLLEKKKTTNLSPLRMKQKTTKKQINIQKPHP